MIIKSVVMGWMLFVSPIPQPIPAPTPEVVHIHVGLSEHDKEVAAAELEHQKQVEAERLRYEQSWRSGIATAYYNGKDEMNGETGITGSGWNLDMGIIFHGYRILASDNSIPFGTLVDIKINDEVIHGVVLDRGGSIKGNHFDLVLESKAECIEFGKQDIQWQIVGKINY